MSTSMRTCTWPALALAAVAAFAPPPLRGPAVRGRRYAADVEVAEDDVVLFTFPATGDPSCISACLRFLAADGKRPPGAAMGSGLKSLNSSPGCTCDLLFCQVMATLLAWLCVSFQKLMY